MDETPTLLAAFGAGFCSLISPGIAPLLPGFAGFLRGRGIGHLLAFLLGFSLVFIALGASATAAGQALLERLELFEGAAGVFLAALGLRRIGIPTRSRAEPAPEPATPGALLMAFLAGAALMFGWTPLAGVVLSRILAAATSADAIDRGVTLLSAYALGRGVALLAFGLALPAMPGLMQAIRPHARLVDVISGALVAVTGLLIFTGAFPIVAAALSEYLPLF